MSKGEATRATILEHAVREATVVGLEGLSIGELAKDLRMSKSGLFAHFRSKEELQLQVVAHASARFVDDVVRPALKQPRGEPRLRELLARWSAWIRLGPWEHGCFFLAAAAELDDRPGPVRDAVVAAQRDWTELLAGVARGGVDAGHFRPDLDPAQLGFELYGVIMACHHARRLLADPEAEARLARAIDRLLADARP